MAYSIVKHRRGTTEEWQKLNIVPAEGEIVIEECLDGVRKCKIGDGLTSFAALPYLADDVKAYALSYVDLIAKHIRKDLANQSEQNAAELEKARQTLLKAISANATDLNATIAEEDAKVLAAAKSFTADSIDEAKQELLADVSGVIASLENTVNTDKIATASAITDAESRAKTFTLNKVKETATSFGESLDSLTEAFEANLEASDNALNSRIDTVANNLSQVRESLTYDIDAKAVEVSQAAYDQLVSLEQRQNAKLDVVSTTVKNNKEDLAKQITSLATEASTALQALEERLESDYKKLIDDAKAVACQYAKTEDEVIQKALTAVKQASKEHDDKLAIHTAAIGSASKSITDLDAAYRSLNKSVEAISATHAEEITNIVQTVSALQTLVSDLQDIDADQAELIKSLTDELSARVDNVSSKLNVHITANETAFQNVAIELSSIKRTIAAGDKEIADDLTAATDDIYNKLASLLTKDDELQKTLNDAITELNDTIRSNVSVLNGSIREHSQQLADLEYDLSLKHRNSIEQIRALEARAYASDAEVAATVAEVSDRVDQVTETIEQTNAEIATQARRISNIASLPFGSTTGDAELLDIRVGYDGIQHLSAGDAVRQIGKDLEELKDTLPDYIPATSIDGLYYEDNILYLTSNGKHLNDAGEPLYEPAEVIGGGGGGSGALSVVRLTDTGSTNITIAKDKEVNIQFRYSSTEEGVPTQGEGTVIVTINSKKIADLGCAVQQNELKVLEVSKYLKEGTNTVKVTCNDINGASRNVVFSISVVDLRIESVFDASTVYNGPIIFRYKVFGLIQKTAHVFIDDNEVSTVPLSSAVTGRDTTYTIPKQPHGCHKITAYVTARVGTDDITSNILEYEILCTETENDAAMLASVFTVKKVTQGDLVSIPYMLYDPNSADCSVELSIYSELGGERILESTTSVTVGRGQQIWNTRKYPAPRSIFVIKYSYTLYDEPVTLTREHIVDVEALKVDVSAETDSLQLALSAAGRLNSETDKDKWEFRPAASAGSDAPALVTTQFKNFNWVSNGWVKDSSGDTCLRLSGDARAIVNFKIFEQDFKALGKTIEFEFAVRDVHSRDTIVIDCIHVFDEDDEIVATNARGFAATPDTAYLKSSGTEVSCNYKDEERIRIAVTVEDMNSISKFVSIYIDGVLSGVQRYETDTFSQQNPVNIRLGSNDCCLDLYSIRVYNKALSHEEILNNYIADQADPAVKLQLVTDNSIIDPITKQVSYERVAALKQIPIVTFTGPMPTFKGDKKKDTTYITFEDFAHPELSFYDVLLKELDVQGTSSAGYVRKNWKLKFYEKIQHMVGAIKAKVYCIKVDYAEATGTHNTGCANFVETLYDRTKAILPPQKDDPQVRTTIQGFPCVLFEKATKDSTPVFSSKGNFNYDKGAENAFGFTEDYNSFGVECWEFKNNTSNSCNFTGEIPDEWSGDFEPRYVPESYGFDSIEKLLERKEDAEATPPKATMTPEEYRELADLQRNCIKNFKEMHDWVRSTATYDLIPDPNDTSDTPKLIKVPLTKEEADARLLKFKNEFTNYFNMHYSCIYYVFTFVALMTDQRAKNMFLTRWKDSDGKYRWYPYFYDNDTIFGINNEGALVFDYYHEDIDQVGSSNVYNGQNSVLWNNFRECFSSEIQETYASLRTKGADNTPPKLSYDKLINCFVTNGSDKWSAAIYNADAEYKYVSMAREPKEDGTVNTANLYQVRGTGEQHLRYFVANRLKYCDSKWYAGDYPTDYIYLRIYTPEAPEITDSMTDDERANSERIAASLIAVPPSANISVVPFSDMYAGVRYKANGRLQQQRVKAGSTDTEFGPDDANEKFHDTETYIYGASELSSLGDLSKLYCGVIDLSNASKLVELRLGNANPAYYNDNFREVHVGANRLLKLIDLRNCAGLGIAGEPQKTLALSGCPNIETIYTEGTNLASIDLPASGYIKTLHYPSSISTINIQNQPHITDFLVANDDYSNVRTLRIEDCPTLDTNEMLEKCQVSPGVYSVEQVRLSGINWTMDDATFVKSLFPRVDALNNLIGGIRGIDEKNIPTDDAYLKGTCKISSLSGADYAEIKSHYPDLTIKFDNMTSVLNFKCPNISLVDGVIKHNGYNEASFNVDSTDSVLPNFTDTAPTPPAWPENDAFTYEHVGWSRLEQPYLGIEDHEDNYNKYLQKDAMKSIAGARTIYPVFKAIRKSYTVKFINPTAPIGDQVINKDQEIRIPYGSSAIYENYGYETPVRLDSEYPELYTHTGWLPDPSPVLCDMECVAQFAFVVDEDLVVPLSDISEYKDYWGNDQMGYSINEADKTMAITSCQNKWSPAMIVPEKYTIPEIGGTEYTVVTLGGFSDCHSMEKFIMPDTVTTLSARALYNCYKLFDITLPPNLTSIGMYALQGCSRLKEITIPPSVQSIGDAALADCTSLERINIEGNPYFSIENGCLIDIATKSLIQGGLPGSSIPPYSVVESLRPYCFSNSDIQVVNIPDGIVMVPSNAFSRCEQLESLTLPDSITELDATCFAWCYKLGLDPSKPIVLPKNLRVIKTYVFNGCAIQDIEIPASVTSLLERSFGDLARLKTVKFNKNEVAGVTTLPFIHEAAFADSGSEEGVTFYLPWAEDQVAGAPWGAKNATLIYNYNEEVSQ